MSSPSVSVSVVYATLLKQYLKDLNQKSATLIWPVEKSQNGLYAEHWVPLSDIVGLMRCISQQTGNARYGLEIGNSIHPSDYGIMGYALMSCDHLRHALKFVVDYKRLLNQGFSASLKKQGCHRHYQLDSWLNHKNLAPLIELDFASALQFARLLAGKHRHQVSLECVLFQHQPLADPGKYQEVFQCPVIFGQAHNGMVISESVLDIPVHGANPQIFNMLNKKLLSLKKSQEDSQTLSEQVQQYLRQNPGRCLPDSNQCAQRFHMSISAFKKHLQAENISYQFICDQIRHQRATKLVCQNTLSLKEVSFQLGFANPSAFNRAFKRWTQLSPAEYRKRYAHQIDHSEVNLLVHYS